MRVDLVITIFLSLLLVSSWFGFARGLRLARVLGFDERFQVVEAGLPEDPVLLDPGIDGAQRFGIQLVNTIAAFTMFPDEMRPAQEAQMFGDGGTRDRESIGDLSGRRASAG